MIEMPARPIGQPAACASDSFLQNLTSVPGFEPGYGYLGVITFVVALVVVIRGCGRILWLIVFLNYTHGTFWMASAVEGMTFVKQDDYARYAIAVIVHAVVIIGASLLVRGARNRRIMSRHIGRRH